MRSVLVLLIALVSGCKGLGALGHGLGALGHVASHVGRIAAVSSRAIAPVWRAAVRVAPAVLNTAVAVSEGPVVVEEVEPVEHVPPPGGPLIDDGDTCGYCPEDEECGACGDVNNVACVLSPQGAYARCESQLKLHPPGA